jgi:hypothetical protein
MPDSATRTRARRGLPPTPGAVCTCRRLEGAHNVNGRTIGGYLVPGGRPMTIATFRDGNLVDITLQHWAGRDHCPLPAEHLDPREWLKS